MEYSRVSSGEPECPYESARVLLYITAQFIVCRRSARVKAVALAEVATSAHPERCATTLGATRVHTYIWAVSTSPTRRTHTSSSWLLTWATGENLQSEPVFGLDATQSRELIFHRRLTARAAYLAMEHDSLRARWLSLAASILLCLIAGVAYASSLYCFRPSPWREPPRAVATYDDAETRARYQSSDCAKRDPWPRAGLHCP